MNGTTARLGFGSILQDLRNRRLAGETFYVVENGKDYPVEDIIVHTVSLARCPASAVLMSDVDATDDVPGLFQSWKSAGIVGGVYSHHRMPNWYIREDTTGIIEDSRVRAFLQQQFERDLTVRETIQMLVRIYG